MTSGVLFGPSDSFRTQRVLIAAKYGDFSVSCPEFTAGVSNTSPEFLKKFPFGRVPALELSKGELLTEAGAISTFVGGEKVIGSDALTKAQVLQWVEVADAEFLPAALGWTLPCLSVMPHNKQNVDQAKTKLLRLLTTLNDYLLSRTYLVGERITLADITLACNLVLPFQNVLEPSDRASIGNVERWFVTCVNQPEFKAVLGEISLCEKAAQFDGKKLKEIQASLPSGASAPTQKSGKREKKTSEKKEEKKGGEGKAAKEPEPAEEPDATEEALALEPKKKDPFDAFQKGTFNLDEFKRVYSNEDTLTKAIPYLWEHWDAENWSMWYCEYKYADELTLVFMSCNLMGGMLQRLDKMRKNAFGSLCLFGSDNNSTISGIWLWRGHELAFTLSPDWQVDYESYEWKKLDPSNEADRKMINEYLAWEGDFDGKKFNQGKIFK